MTATRKLGRRPRTYDPAMPHMAALRMMAPAILPPIPDAVHWTDGMPDDLGMMENARLGCCTCAGAYHAMQVWSYHGRSRILTEPDDEVLRMYCEFCGYLPGQPDTDQGGVEQDVLRDWLRLGVPIVEGSHDGRPGRSRIRVALEVDPHRPDQMRRAIYECGALYVGFEVPQSLMVDPVPEVWAVTTPSNTVGGHCVVLTGYDATGGTFDLISWGRKYRMTETFWRTYAADMQGEAYALLHPWWIDGTGRTPFGLPIDQLAAQMRAFGGVSVDGA